MSVEHWVHPEWIASVAALLVLASAALGFARSVARRRRQRLGPSLRPGISLVRDASLLLALACIGAALIGPRAGEKEVQVPVSGVDVVLLVDVSRSMAAQDVPPSRLTRARQAAEEMLARLAPGDRVALAFFAGRGVLACPLTPDRDAVVQLVRALDTDLLHPASSNLASGLAAALEAFEAGSERPRSVLLLSDGEDPARRGQLGIADVLRAEATVVAAAFGSDVGATVPDRGLPLRDREGAIVVSRRRTERLERLAAATGGALFAADAWGVFDYDAAVRTLRRDELAGAEGMATRRVRAVQVWPLALAAFALLALEGLPRPRRAAGHAAGLAVAGLLLVGAGGGDPAHLEAGLRANPGDPRLLIELGVSRLDRGQREEAMRAFRAAAVGAPDPELAALAWYDYGVAALEQGDLDEAVGAFFDALALAPHDRKARYNLEWSLAALDRRPPEQPPQTRPEPEPRPGAPKEDEPTAESESNEGEELSEAQRRRWLERVEDDLGRALEAAARNERLQRRRGGPAW